MNGVLVSAKGTCLIALVKQVSGNGSVQLADNQLTFNLSNQLRLCVYFILWNTCDLKFRFMLNKHYLGCSNFPLSCFAIIKVNLIAVHLMALNISVLTSRLRLSRYQYTMQRGHPDLCLMRKCLEIQSGFWSILLHCSVLEVSCLQGTWLTLVLPLLQQLILNTIEPLLSFSWVQSSQQVAICSSICH